MIGDQEQIHIHMACTNTCTLLYNIEKGRETERHEDSHVLTALHCVFSVLILRYTVIIVPILRTGVKCNNNL